MQRVLQRRSSGAVLRQAVILLEGEDGAVRGLVHRARRRAGVVAVRRELALDVADADHFERRRKAAARQGRRRVGGNIGDRRQGGGEGERRDGRHQSEGCRSSSSVHGQLPPEQIQYYET